MMRCLLSCVVLAACSYPPLPNPAPDAPPAQPPSLEPLAGTIGGPGNLDGKGPDARFVAPHGLAIDQAGDLYVADAENQTVRKVTRDGRVTTIAGGPGVCGSTDGAAAAAR